MILSLINQFVYRADATFSPPSATPAQLGLTFEDVSLTAADGVALTAWYFPAPRARGAPRAHTALLYLHGNAGNRRDWMHAMPPFVGAGISVLLLDYRGYGDSGGQPSEEGLFLDGAAAWAWLQRRAAAAQLPAAILGKSLGSGVAVKTAVDAPPHKLVLDSAFTSMRELVALHGPAPVRPFVPPLYESLARAPQLRCPTLLVHGAGDTLVPPAMAERLYATLAAPGELVLVPDAGHNDISAHPGYESAVFTFLSPHAHEPVDA